MTDIIIEHDRPNCIGCGACAAIAPKFWEMSDDDGKSNIIKGKQLDNGNEELEIKQKDFADNMEAAEACPVNVIHLIKKDTKEKLI